MSGDSLRARHATLKAQTARLAEAISMAGDMTSLIEKLRVVEKEIDEVQRAIAVYRPRSLDVPAEKIRALVTSAVMELGALLGKGETERARGALAKHVGRLVLTPTIQDGKPLFRVTGAVNLAPATSVMPVVARDGIGPPTAVEGTQLTVSTSCQIR
jgi:hypothetical protein